MCLSTLCYFRSAAFSETDNKKQTKLYHVRLRINSIPTANTPHYNVTQTHVDNDTMLYS